MLPTVGRIVHFKDAEGRINPGIIIRVGEANLATTVDVTVWHGDHQEYWPNVKHGAEPLQWRWPPLAGRQTDADPVRQDASRTLTVTDEDGSRTAPVTSSNSVADEDGTAIENLLESYPLKWSPEATDHEKTLVLGNLRGFARHVLNSLKKPSEVTRGTIRFDVQDERILIEIRPASTDARYDVRPGIRSIAKDWNQEAA